MYVREYICSSDRFFLIEQSRTMRLEPGANSYVRSENPGRLQLEDDMTQYQILAQRHDKHIEAMRVF